MKDIRVNIILLNYNGRDLLEKYLPSFEKAAAKSRHRCRLSVVDNESRDESLRFLRERFPSVEAYEAPKNRVLCSYNEYVGAIEDEIVILMNNDIAVDEGFVDPLVEPFLKDLNVFFVTPRCLSQKTGDYEGNKTRGYVRYGIYWSSSVYPGYEKEIDRPGPTLQGGFGAFDRKKLVELRGYDDLYLPGRLEDADLCFRAYKRGWACLYEPASIVYHEGGVSFHRKFGVKGTLVINARNTFLFMWKNIGDPRLWLEFFFWLPARLLYSLLSLKPELFLGFMKALPLLGKALARRRSSREAGPARFTDREIFGRV